MPLSKLPPKASTEWSNIVTRYTGGSVESRKRLSAELGYSYIDDLTQAMRARGVLLRVPETEFPNLAKSLTIKEDCLIIFDTQVPFQDAAFLNRVLWLANSWGIEQGISGGDLLNMTAFSRFSEDPDAKRWKTERRIAAECIEAMVSHIPKWYLIKGNHEGFLLRMVSEQLKHQDILRLLDMGDVIVATDKYWCWVNIAGSKWRITHPRNISVIHGRIPQRLCEKYHCNVASGHGHLAGMTPDFANKYIACDVGITCDPARLDYVSERDSTRPAMCQGALILKTGTDGKCHPYHLTPDIDWEAMRRLY